MTPTAHDAGSTFLVEMGEILKATFRETDVLGRVGGDEFAVAGRIPARRRSQLPPNAFAGSLRLAETAKRAGSIHSEAALALSVRESTITSPSGTCWTKPTRQCIRKNAAKKALPGFGLSLSLSLAVLRSPSLPPLNRRAWPNGRVFIFYHAAWTAHFAYLCTSIVYIYTIAILDERLHLRSI